MRRTGMGDSAPQTLVPPVIHRLMGRDGWANEKTRVEYGGPVFSSLLARTPLRRSSCIIGRGFNFVKLCPLSINITGEAAGDQVYTDIGLFWRARMAKANSA